jgi:3-oxoacyl-[acyl-carrier protein] reductase
MQATAMAGTFQDQVVVVTGGSRGIGREIVGRFAAHGARVFFTYHRQDELADSVAKSCGANQIRCSQSDAAAIESAVSRILAEAGRIDVLVNNAGITSDQFVMMMPPESWEKVLDTNLNGAFRWSKAVSRPMLAARHGVIVNVASVSGLIGIPGQANYAASKGALLAFTRALAAEMGPKGVRVNAVVPGFIDTDMTARMPRPIKRQSLERILLQRFGQPAEVAAAVLFLASADASYIVGQTVVVDGGLSATVPAAGPS